MGTHFKRLFLTLGMIVSLAGCHAANEGALDLSDSSNPSTSNTTTGDTRGDTSSGTNVPPVVPQPQPPSNPPANPPGVPPDSVTHPDLPDVPSVVTQPEPPQPPLPSPNPPVVPPGSVAEPQTFPGSDVVTEQPVPPGPVHPGIPDSPLSDVVGQRECRGDLNENFKLAGVRFYFYTGRKEGAGVNQAIYMGPRGTGGMLVLSFNDSSAPGRTEEGSIDEAKVMFAEDALFTVSDFAKVKISVASETVAGSDKEWFLGGLIIQGLKRGCDPSQGASWTTLYFNPVVRTWITPSRPLIVSEEDAVAIFGAYVGNRDDANSDDDIYIRTPLEKVLPPNTRPSSGETPALNYGHSFRKNQVTYEGRSYFAEPQATSVDRLAGKFTSLTPENVAAGFLLFDRDDDGVYFNNFYAYLIRPLYYTGNASPLFGYAASRSNFWLDGEDCIFIACSPYDQQTVPVVSNMPMSIGNFGQPIADLSPLGILRWMASHDDPARQ